MSRLKLRSWNFNENEEVELYWHGMPFMNSEGLWMIKCLFKRIDGTFLEHVFPFWTLPHLRIGQTYVDGDFSEKSGTGSLYEVRITNSTRFDICKGFDFPKSLYSFSKPPAPSYGNLLLCRFEVKGIQYYIPCTEIVRCILAPNKMFANRILRPDGLDSFIEGSFENINKLELKLTEEYHPDFLRDEVISYFVLLRFNKTANRSWNSVYRNLILDATNSSGSDIQSELRKGVPIRVTPPISGSTTWTFRGLTHKNHRLILELTYQSELEIPFTDIIYYHPKLERLETDGQLRYTKDPTKKPSDNKDMELDTTGQGAEKQPGHNIIEQPPVMFSFKRKPRIFKKWSKIRKIHSGDVIVIGTKQDEENENNVGTTQDWVLGGKIPQIEFSILKMVDASITKGLEEFLKMIEHIQIQHKQLILSLSIIQLPQFKSFSRYEDGSIRTCAIVKVKRNGHMPCFVVEVARADMWSVSTLIIKPLINGYADTNSFESLSQRLLKKLVDNGGHWDKEQFRSINGYMFDTAKHMSEQPIIRWSERIVEKMM